ncbi:MAG: ATP-binding protein [Planctomycetota bacterium]|nr:ATP-binding protein [Planctomycetota bacterium]
MTIRETEFGRIAGEPVREQWKALVVGRDAGERGAIGTSLAAEGFKVVATGPEAGVSERLKAEPFDLAILDLKSPADPGCVDLCRRIKGDPDLSWLPVMAILAGAGKEEIARAFEAGADEFVKTPFSADELTVRARVLVRKGREERWLMERARRLAQKVAERDDELDDLRRFAQDIVSSLSSSLLVLDAEWTVLFANDAFLKAVGRDRRDVAGRNLADFLSPRALKGPLGDALNSAVIAGRPGGVRRAPGLLAAAPDRIYDVRVTPIEYGGVRQILVALDDVTEQARAEEEVARERAKLNDIVNAMNAGLCLIGPDRGILWQNRTFGIWFGDSYGQPGLAAFRAQIDSAGNLVEEVLRTGTVLRQNWSVFTPTGQRRFFSNILAPIRDQRGNPFQVISLTQDVTDQETRLEQLNLLRELSIVLQGTLEQDKLFRVILICATAGHALGFNRAFLFTRNRQKNTLDGRMAVGPSSREEAFRIWAELSTKARSLHELLRSVESSPVDGGPLHRMVRELSYPMDDPSEIVPRTALEKKAQLVTDAVSDPRVTERFRRLFGTNGFVSVPMVAKGTVVGVLLADNLYSGRQITEEHVKLLTLFAGQAGLAIENAETYAELQLRLQELKRIQDALVHSEKLATVGKMAAHVAHEIRNPLATIGGFARTIMRKPSNTERVIRNARIIAEEVVRLENILRAVMDFSRPATPQLKPADLNALIERVCRVQNETLLNRNIRLFLDLDRSLPDVMIDETQISQVLINLIQNAADSMPAGGELSISSRRKEDMAEMSVADTGVGIPPELMDRIFSPFFTTKQNGTGLGLAVSKKIIDDHGGRVMVSSERGKGTQFVIHLPLKGRAG